MAFDGRSGRSVGFWCLVTVVAGVIVMAAIVAHAAGLGLGEHGAGDMNIGLVQPPQGLLSHLDGGGLALGRDNYAVGQVADDAGVADGQNRGVSITMYLKRPLSFSSNLRK